MYLSINKHVYMDSGSLVIYLPFAWASLLWRPSKIAHLICSFAGTALYARRFGFSITSDLTMSVTNLLKVDSAFKQGGKEIPFSFYIRHKLS